MTQITEGPFLFYIILGSLVLYKHAIHFSQVSLFKKHEGKAIQAHAQVVQCLHYKVASTWN